MTPRHALTNQPNSEPTALRALRLVALVETVSFVVLLTTSVLKRTTEFNAVPVMGPIHGVLFLALVLLALDQRVRLGWSWAFTGAMLTVGSPGAHFAVRASRLPRAPMKE